MANETDIVNLKLHFFFEQYKICLPRIFSTLKMETAKFLQNPWYLPYQTTWLLRTSQIPIICTLAAFIQ
jgi:hypothetical protein